METIGLTQAKTKLGNLVETSVRTTIIRNNEPVAVVLPIKDYRALEIFESLMDKPEELARILSDHRAALAGDFDEELVELDELETRIRGRRSRDSRGRPRAAGKLRGRPGAAGKSRGRR